MSLAEPLERIGPLLDASGAGHWVPVLVKWISNGDGWRSPYSAVPDPDYSELLAKVESLIPAHQVEFQLADDIALAHALAETNYARRAAAIRSGTGAAPVRWSVCDGPFHLFQALAEDQGQVVGLRTYYDVLCPTSRLRDELLGRMLVSKARGA